MAAEGTLINGFYHDHSSRRVTFGDTEIAGISEISYRDGLEPGVVPGTRAIPMGMTRGKYEAEASLTMNKRRWQKYVASKGDGFLERVVPVSISHRDDDGYGMITDELVGARVTKVEDSSSEGGDPINVQITLKPIYIKWNGVNPLFDVGE
jgi:hypothetical protein